MRGQLTGVDLLLVPAGSGEQTQVVRVGNKCP